MKEKDILVLKSLITNVDIKIATATDVTTERRNQILCVVTSKNQLVLRYVTETAEVILKKVDWFHQNEKGLSHHLLPQSYLDGLRCCLEDIRYAKANFRFFF